MSETFRPREDRTKVSWIAMIRLADGSSIPCTVKDVSSSGMKLTVGRDTGLPDAFTLKVVGRELVFRVRQAWRRDHDVGVVVEKIAKLPPRPVPPAEAERPTAGDAHASLGTRRRFGLSR